MKVGLGTIRIIFEGSNLLSTLLYWVNLCEVVNFLGFANGTLFLSRLAMTFFASSKLTGAVRVLFGSLMLMHDPHKLLPTVTI